MSGRCKATDKGRYEQREQTCKKQGVRSLFDDSRRVRIFDNHSQTLLLQVRVR